MIQRQEPCYRRENRATPLWISIRIELYNGTVWFLRLSCIHQRPFKCWSYTQYDDFHGCDPKSRRKPKITAHDQNHSKSHGDRERVIILQR